MGLSFECFFFFFLFVRIYIMSFIFFSKERYIIKVDFNDEMIDP